MSRPPGARTMAAGTRSKASGAAERLNNDRLRFATLAQA
jgi:hypothetical protein